MTLAAFRLALPLAAAALLAAPVQAQNNQVRPQQPPQQQRPQAQPQRPAQQGQRPAQVRLAPAVVAARPAILVRGTLTALDQANRVNNYAVLRALGTESFRANSVERLGATYKTMREQRVDLTRTLILDPVFSSQTQIDRGTLFLIGFFPAVNNRPRINFDLRYKNDNGSWKIDSMAVNLGAPQAR